MKKMDTVGLIGTIVIYGVVVVLLAGMLSELFAVLPYVLMVLIFGVPVYGLYRERRAKGKGLFEYLKQGTFIKKHMTKGVVLIIGLAFLLSVEKFVAALVTSASLLLTTVACVYFVWEGIRYMQKKNGKKEIPAFVQAVKKAC